MVIAYIVLLEIPLIFAAKHLAVSLFVGTPSSRT